MYSKCIQMYKIAIIMQKVVVKKENFITIREINEVWLSMGLCPKSSLLTALLPASSQVS